MAYRYVCVVGNSVPKAHYHMYTCMCNAFAVIVLPNSRYVVKALWSPTGKRFVTASYDKSVIGYRYMYVEQ